MTTPDTRAVILDLIEKATASAQADAEMTRLRALKYRDPNLYRDAWIADNDCYAEWEEVALPAALLPLLALALKGLDAEEADSKGDGSWLWDQCYSCGHLLRFASDGCPQCGIHFDGRPDPQEWPTLCDCQRCKGQAQETPDE